MRLAMAFRERFGRDVLIDLVGYRRFGHNESDEPAYTQPQQVRAHQGAPARSSTLYARRLIDDGLVDEDDVVEIAPRADAASTLAEAHAPVRAGTEEHDAREPRDAWRATSTRSTRTRPRGDELDRALRRAARGARGLHRAPEARDAARAPARRRRARAASTGATPRRSRSARCWPTASPIRLTGQDTERGTFSHRHAVLHDVHTGERYTPMQHLPDSQARFEIHNSPLSENVLPRLRVRLLGHAAATRS